MEMSMETSLTVPDSGKYRREKEVGGRFDCLVKNRFLSSLAPIRF